MPIYRRPSKGLQNLDHVNRPSTKKGSTVRTQSAGETPVYRFTDQVDDKRTLNRQSNNNMGVRLAEPEGTCSAKPGQINGQDYNVEYVYKHFLRNVLEIRLAYVECDYVE